MRLCWERRSRLPTPPHWALAVLGGWGLLVLMAEGLRRTRGTGVSLCLFRNLTGHPCPTCGSTRIVFHLLGGRPSEAFGLNPMVALGLVGGFALLLLRLLTGWVPRLEAGARGRRVLLVLVLLAAALDWAWVWVHA